MDSKSPSKPSLRSPEEPSEEPPEEAPGQSSDLDDPQPPQVPTGLSQQQSLKTQADDVTGKTQNPKKEKFDMQRHIAKKRLEEESLSKDMKGFMFDNSALMQTMTYRKEEAEASDEDLKKQLNLETSQLLAAKRRLRPVNRKTHFHPEKLGRRELLKDYDWDMDYLPIPVIRESIRNTSLSADLVSLDFSGIEQLTDFLFYVLKITRSSFPSMEKFVATGCVHLSDQGLTWMSELSPKLAAVEVQGCSGISEKGIHKLALNCPDLHKLIITATSVNRLGSALAETKLSSVTFEGCPMISTSDKFALTTISALKGQEDSGEFWRLPSNKIVVVRDADMDVSVSPLLTGATPQNSCPTLLYTQDWRPDGEAGEGQGSFNIMEVPSDSVLVDAVISPGSIVLLAFTNNTDNQLCSKLAARLASVLSKCQDCRVGLLAVQEGKTAPSLQLPQLLTGIKDTLMNWLQGMNCQFELLTSRQWRLECVDFVNQLSMAAGAADLEVLKRILEKDQIGTFTLSKNTPINKKTLSDFFYKTLKDLYNDFPWLFKQVRKECIDVLSEIKKKTYWNLEKVFHNFPEDAKRMLNHQNSYLHVSSLLKLMNSMGTCLYYPSLRDFPCVSDVQHLAQVLEKLVSTQPPQQVNIKCLGENIPCWETHQLDTLLMEQSLNKVQAEGLTELLVKIGFLLTMTLPENSTKLYVLQFHLPTSPAVGLHNVWREECSDKSAYQGSRYYSFLPGIPLAFFSSLTRELLKVWQPLLLWRSGVLIQQGPVFVLIRLANNIGTKFDGSPVISVQARLPRCKVDPKDISVTNYARQCMFALLNTVCSQVDYLLRKYNVCAFVSTPCLSCMQNNKDPLRREHVFHFDVPSILAGHDRGILCRYEREQRKAKIRADKPLLLGADLPSIVPYHNYSYLCAVKPLVETGDLGEDITEDEIRKKITVSPRISSCCLCIKGEVKLCHHCGMCQRCIHKLAKIEHFVKPSFMTPQLIAIRDVSGKSSRYTTDDSYLVKDHMSTGLTGCVLWPVKGLEYHILQPMTTTYFNTFLLTPVRGSMLAIKLKIKDHEQQLCYHILSGSIDNLNGDVDQDDSWKCRDGYTIMLRLLDSQVSGMVDIVFFLNGQEIWRKAFEICETSVTVSSEVTGTVIVHAPGIKRRQGPEFEAGMQVRISTKDRQVSSLQRDRIGEVAPSHVAASGLLRLIPVHTPVTSFLVKLTTGEHQNAGTNANIFIQLFGSKNVSKRISLKKTSENMFQRESEDEFRIETADIGDITCIKLGHDGMNLEDSWFVKSVIVSAPILEYSTSFICNWWLSTQLGDKQLERLFYPQSTDMKGSLQENFNPLSDKLQPLTVQQWRDITGNHDIDDAQLPPLAPSWLFYDIQLQSKPFANMATTLSNVNQFIMPCTQVPLPSAVWCKMMKMRDKLERTLFQYSHIDFSGTSSVLLPQQVREKDVEWPAPELWDAPTNLHPVCYVRGDMSTVVTLRPTYTLPDYMRAFWTAHLLNAPGFPFLLDDDQLITIPILWAWHFVVALNKQFKLPEYQAMFLNAESIPGPEKVSKLIEMYLVQMCYRLFLLLPPDFSLDFFSESNTDLVQKAVGMLRYSLLDNFKETMLEKTRTVFGDDEIFLCSSHLNAWQTSSELSCVPLEKISDYSQYMFTLHLQGNNITCVPKELFCQLPHLKDLDFSSNQIRKIPEEIGLCVGMLNLSLKGNNLTGLPDSIRNMELLNRFDISNNQMREVPWCVTQLRKLVCLYMRTMQLRSLPEDIGNLTLLEKLYLNENCIHQLPASFKNLKNLTELSLNGVSWVKIKSNTILSKVNFENFLKAANLLHWLSSNEQEKSAIFKYFDENTNGTLEPKEIGKLNATIFYTFPRFGYMGSQVPDEDMPHGFPEEILHLEKLTYLSLQYQAIVAVPDQISRLKNLKVLNISHNPNLLSLSAQTGSLPLKRLELEDCPLLKTPPKEIRAKGFITTYAYLKRLLSGSVDCKRTKLMMVGLGGAGKTSLVKALLSGNHKAELAVGEEITDGIDICPWKVLTEEGQLTFNIWDFAGQTVYYNTHQFFLSDRAIYMLLWNIRLGHEHAGLDFWLSSISVHAPKAPILVIGTHVDQVSKVEIPVKAMKLRYPQIAGFHFVSSHSGQGIGELKSELLEVTLHQSYMGEKIPGAWLTFEEQIISLKDRSVIEYRELEKKANISGIFSQSEVHQAVQFLHELGSLQYFSNEYLKAYVVVNPQWIVDVMACVVSVKDSPIKEGRLNHCDIPLVWRDYPENLHKWLLRLTEEFDLTFPLSSEDVNLVPCLLPEKEPEISLPELDKKGSIRKTKMLYKFDYLPAGLFNRGQVRLHQFSDSALIWKKGSFLNKNKHICLIKQTRESELLVEAQGPRPENIVFLVHEVFETLIMESFHGVTYDYQLPCPDCLKLGSKKAETRYTTPLGEQVEEPWQLTEWTASHEDIPALRYADLYNYLVLNKNRTFDCKATKAKRQLKARVFYEEGHVHSITYHKITQNCSHCYVKSKVIPSIPTAQQNKRPDYTSWVLLAKMSGNVHAAGCTCAAGEGESCNHVAALLYALVDMSDKKEKGLHAPTSKKCKWLEPRKRKLSPKKSQHLAFKKFKVSHTTTNQNLTQTWRSSDLVNIKPVNIEKFSNKLNDISPSAGFLLSQEKFAKEKATSVHPLPKLHSIEFAYHDSVDLKSDKCKHEIDCYFKSLQITRDECKDIEAATKGQAHNPSWHVAREGRITTSNFGRICIKKDETPPESTVAQVLSYKSFDNVALRWGRSHEAAARRTYLQCARKTHTPLKYSLCGLIVCPSFPHLGSSPDALLECMHCSESQGLLEIKCPYSKRFVTPFEAASDKTFCCTIVNGELKLKHKHPYYYQVQGQLAISERKWCDFFIWTLKGYSVERIFFDSLFWQNMLLKLNGFYLHALLPELFSHRVKRDKPLF